MDLALDGTGDIYQDSTGSFVIVEGPALIAQNIWVALNTLRGEFIFNTAFGTDYRGRIWLKPVKLNLTEAELKRVIAGVEGVIAITSFTLDFDPVTRSLSIAFSALVEGGFVLTASGGASSGLASSSDVILTLSVSLGTQIIWPMVAI